jgi:hypothetical protein
MVQLRTSLALLVCIVFAAIAAGAASAGEITGNGQLKAVNGNSPCAFSGQEDRQWYTDDTDTTALADPIKGDPGVPHSQNWGHVKQVNDLTGGANSVPAVDWGCNGHLYGLKP